MTSYTAKRRCQLCGEYFFRISHHVRTMHHTTVTDLIVEGKWKNESEFQDDKA